MKCYAEVLGDRTYFDLKMRERRIKQDINYCSPISAVTYDRAFGYLLFTISIELKVSHDGVLQACKMHWIRDSLGDYSQGLNA
jgi:hypothetical protein